MLTFMIYFVLSVGYLSNGDAFIIDFLRENVSLYLYCSIAKHVYRYVCTRCSSCNECVSLL